MGGWRWVASVGAESQPPFQVFNPVTQSERFDPEGVFIKKWVPELGQLPAAAIHDPSAVKPNVLKGGITVPKTYPKPLVVPLAQRARWLAMLQEKKGGAAAPAAQARAGRKRSRSPV
jgi:deoxyribodipyrimidine photo-lyase